MSEGKGTIIDRALKGDARALDRLYQQYYSIVKRFTYSIDPGAPEDRVQLVLIKVLELLRNPEKDFDQDFPQKFTGWLFRVAKNVVSDERKRHLRQSRFASLDGGAPERSGKIRTPSQIAVHTELESMLRTQIDGLPSLYREVLERYFFQQRSHREIAEELGLDEITVRKRMQRACERLRSTLKSVATTLYRKHKADC